MNSFQKEGGAATPQSSNRLQLKNATKTKVNRLVNFQLGLIVALVLVYISIEITTATEERIYVPTTTKTMSLEATMGEYRIVENRPKQKQVSKPATPKAAPTKKFDLSKPPVIDDTTDDSLSDQIDQLIPVDNGQDDPVVDLPTVDGTAKNTPPANSHINMVMEVPLFPGCSPSMNREERIDCLNKKMTRFVQRKFDARHSGNLESGSQVRISVVFTIGTDGLPTNIQVKAPNKELEKEALSVIRRLPEMVPGKNNGSAVNVTYVLPIVYQLQ